LAFALQRKDIEIAVRAALWAALIAVGAMVAIPIGPVPITLQSFFLILCGFVEGPKAFFPPLLYLLAAVVGLPVLAGGAAGPGFLLGPTAGFALAFPLAALVAGLAVYRPGPLSYLLFGALATIITNASGMLGLHINLSLSYTKALYVVLPFLPGATLKLLVATALMGSAARVFTSLVARGGKPSDGAPDSGAAA
jgi:biotin transport system substrate-specific component